MGMFCNPLWSNDERFASLRRTSEATRTTDIVFDCADRPGKFWFEMKNVLQVTQPLVLVLRKVDRERPPLAYVYKALSRAKQGIHSYLTKSGFLNRFANIPTRIYERWDNQMHNDLHAAAPILNPQFGFEREI
eukprot:TRINITY_DN3277_c0_g1_i17.p1 TRINITY_DN3277_c0_g1~~TRINITY_DN3277_c0_g1_i17.p1  ORF type:complete len:133 (+),score=19.64 TRINITY_DN3277_c0_g1_i17:130-528(+)